jgi:hypothetical protein
MNHIDVPLNLSYGQIFFVTSFTNAHYHSLSLKWQTGRKPIVVKIRRKYLLKFDSLWMCPTESIKQATHCSKLQILTIMTVTINLILRLCLVFTFGSWLCSFPCCLSVCLLTCLLVCRRAIRLLCKCTSTVIPVHAMTVYVGSSSTAPLILNLCTRCKRLVT